MHGPPKETDETEDLQSAAEIILHRHTWIHALWEHCCPVWQLQLSGQGSPALSQMVCPTHHQASTRPAPGQHQASTRPGQTGPSRTSINPTVNCINDWPLPSRSTPWGQDWEAEEELLPSGSMNPEHVNHYTLLTLILTTTYSLHCTFVNLSCTFFVFFILGCIQILFYLCSVFLFTGVVTINFTDVVNVFKSNEINKLSK